MATLKDQTNNYISKNLPYWIAKVIRSIGYFVQSIVKFLIELLHDFLGR